MREHAAGRAASHARAATRAPTALPLPAAPRRRSFDDTNPDKENDVYIASITENVAWLGWRPVATTHSSDYFEQLYACAERLIAADKAYV